MMFSLKISKNATEKLFSSIVFLSSFLFFTLFLFYVERITPLFAGAPNVFNVAALFFSVCALLGALAVYFSSCLSQQRLAVVLAGFLFLSVFFLPFHVTATFLSGVPFLACLKTLFLSGFVPFFVLSWAFFFFNKTFTTPRKPIVLIAFASLCGQLCYVWGLSKLDFNVQGGILTVLYVLYVIAFLFGLYFLNKTKQTAENAPVQAQNVPVPDTGKKLFVQTDLKKAGANFLYGFVGMCLFLSVTQYILVNIPPHLPKTVLPLLLTAIAFILAFSKLSDLYFKIALFLQPFALALFFVIYLFSFVDVWLSLNLTVFAVFVSVIACQSAEKAEEKDVFVAGYQIAGMVFAAFFNALLAPELFGWPFEFPFAVLLAVAIRPGIFFAGRSAHQVWQDFAYPLALFFLCFCGYFLTTSLSPAYQLMLEAVVFVVVGGLCLLRQYPLRYAMTGAVALIFGAFIFAEHNKASVFNRKPISIRNFYGSLSVSYEKDASERFVKLYMNNFLKGIEKLSDSTKAQPLSPYDAKSGAGKFFLAAREVYKSPVVGVIGMGAGTLAAYASNPYESWRFFEPDAAVADLAAGYVSVFSFYRQNTPYSPVIVGEPVLNLARERMTFDILIVDTFAFRTFPDYLMSPDAIAVYLSRLGKKGTLVFHTIMPPNTWLPELKSVLKHLPVYAAVYRNPDFPESQWIAVTFNEDVITTLRKTDNLWESLFLR